MSNIFHLKATFCTFVKFWMALFNQLKYKISHAWPKFNNYHLLRFNLIKIEWGKLRMVPIFDIIMNCTEEQDATVKIILYCSRALSHKWSSSFQSLHISWTFFFHFLKKIWMRKLSWQFKYTFPNIPSSIIIYWIKGNPKHIEEKHIISTIPKITET